MKRILSYSEFLTMNESVESNTRKANLLSQKAQLLEKKKQASANNNEIEKTNIEKQIALIDAELDKIKEQEKSEQGA